MNINLKKEIGIITEADTIDGGLADNKSPEYIAHKHHAPIELIELMIEWGIEVEMEHTSDMEIAKEIAMDHLMEDPLYYKKIKELGL